MTENKYERDFTIEKGYWDGWAVPYRSDMNHTAWTLWKLFWWRLRRKVKGA